MFQSIIYKSHVHRIDKSSAEFFPSIGCQMGSEIVRLNSPHLLAELIGQDGQLHLPQFGNVHIITFLASFVTKTPTLKERFSYFEEEFVSGC